MICGDLNVDAFANKDNKDGAKNSPILRELKKILEKKLGVDSVKENQDFMNQIFTEYQFMMDTLAGQDWSTRDCLSDSLEKNGGETLYTFADIKVNKKGQFVPADQ